MVWGTPLDTGGLVWTPLAVVLFFLPPVVGECARDYSVTIAENSVLRVNQIELVNQTRAYHICYLCCPLWSQNISEWALVGLECEYSFYPTLGYYEHHMDENRHARYWPFYYRILHSNSHRNIV